MEVETSIPTELDSRVIDLKNYLGPFVIEDEMTEEQLEEAFKPEKEANGGIYRGEKTDGLKHGKGQLIFPDGSLYTGLWSKDQMNGMGRKLGSDGSYYIGEYKNGVKHGKCVSERLPNRDKFTGNYVDGVKSGKGCYQLVSDLELKEYEGNYQNDKFNGNGRLEYYNGNSYSGEFKDGVIHGHGQKTYKFSYDVYDGEWVNGKEEGYGIYIWAWEQKKYCGNWKDGLQHGEGTLQFLKTHEEKKGIWENGNLMREL